MPSLLLRCSSRCVSGTLYLYPSAHLRVLCLTHIRTPLCTQESSVEKFGAVHAKVKEGHNEEETTRGASLRELERFFEKEDSSKGYAGLRRVADEDGTAVWTILKDTEVAAQLEKRAGERREEERRHENIFSSQARPSSEATDATSNEVETLRAKLQVAEAARGVAEASAVR